jgi:hypothetical protein
MAALISFPIIIKILPLIKYPHLCSNPQEKVNFLSARTCLLSPIIAQNIKKIIENQTHLVEAKNLILELSQILLKRIFPVSAVPKFVSLTTREHQNVFTKNVEIVKRRPPFLMMKIKQSLIAKTIVTLIQASLEIWP